MDNFKELYLEYCKTYNVDPQECVRSELKRLSLVSDESSLTFNLSSHHLSDKTCMILGKLLANDQKFVDLRLNDCTLSNEGLKEICQSMATNTSIKFLELKGNNIHGLGTNALAKMIRQNSTIKSLSLEWNSLGLMDTNSFSSFCESIAMNKTLRDLDLRNNQISHTSASEMSAALESNTSLHTLDLRWNNIGLVGGKALLAALKSNHTLLHLHVAGNNIPDEIVNAIALKISNNGVQAKTSKEYADRTSSLANQLQTVQHEKDRQVNVLLSKIDAHEENGRKTSRAMSEKMHRLQSALEMRMSAMTSMTSKLSMAEADLALAEQRCADLEHKLHKVQLERDTEAKLAAVKFKRDKEDLSNEKSKLEKELSAMSHTCKQLEEKLADVERRCNELQMQTYEAKERLAQGQAEYQIKVVVLDDEVRRLKQKHRDELKDLEASKNADLERLKEEHEVQEKGLRERINKLEATKHAQEDEIARLRASLANDKLFHEQEMHEAKLRAQLDETQRRKELEERTRSLLASKEQLADENGKANAKLVEQQQRVASLVLELEALKRSNDTLRLQVSEKDGEAMQAAERAKTDYEKKLRAVHKEIERCDEYKEKVHSLELTIKKMEASNEIDMRSMQMDNEQLKSRLQSLEDIIKRYKEEDESRTRKAHDMLKDVFKPSAVLAHLKS